MRCRERVAMLGTARTSPCCAWECRLLLPSLRLVNAALLPPLADAVHCGTVLSRRRLMGYGIAAKHLVHVSLSPFAHACLCFELMAMSRHDSAEPNLTYLPCSTVAMSSDPLL